MADPKKAGEQADQMIADQNRLRSEAAAAMAAKATAELENQTAPKDAIPETGAVENPTDVGVAVAAPAPVVNSEVEALREQARVADSRWNVLQGMVTKKDQEIENMRLLLAQLSTKNQEPQSASQPHKANAVTAQDVEDFGQDLIDLITKISYSTASAVLAQAEGKIESQVSQLKNSVNHLGAATAQTAADAFNDNLEKRVPNWRQINVDPAFMVWLGSVDDFSGTTRLDLLNDAYGKMQLARTAKFFEEFIKDTKPAAAPAEVAPAANVNALVTPGKSRSASTVPNQQPSKIWTQADIAKLYADQRTGKITKEEFELQERDLYKAQKDNRIAA